MTAHDEAVLAFVKADAERLGMGLREYCREYGITYSSLSGRHHDADAAEAEASLDALDIRDDGQDRLERHMLGGWDDSAYRAHREYLRVKRRSPGP